MKLLIFSFLLLSFVMHAQDSILDLNAENLTLLALKNSPSDVVEAFLTKELKSDYTKEYFQALKNKTGTDELFIRVRQDLETKLLNISNQQVFIYSKAIKYSVEKDSPDSIQINNLFPGVVHFVNRGHDSIKGLPDYYHLLIANLEVLSSIKIDENNWQKFNQKQQDTVWSEVTLIVSNYQNQQSFQTTIKRIDLYKDKRKKQLLISITEDRSFSDIVDDWLLSNGFTTKLAGIHAFSVLGYRLQDRIRKNLLLNNSCEKAAKVNGHQVLMCIHDYTQNSKIIAIFIGGILAQVDLVINNNTTLKEKKLIIRHLTSGLKRNKSFFNDEQKVWERYLVDFGYYPDAFNNLKATVNDEPNKYKLIFSMKSQATNKLFEVNQ